MIALAGFLGLLIGIIIGGAWGALWAMNRSIVGRRVLFTLAQPEHGSGLSTEALARLVKAPVPLTRAVLRELAADGMLDHRHTGEALRRRGLDS